MTETLQELLDRSLPLPGLAACCVRLADRSFVTRCYGDWFTKAQVEQALGRLALAADSLSYHGIQSSRLGWVFEHSRIHLALRPDGGCLAAFLENRSGVASPELEKLLQEFTVRAAL
jgi:hypothetical protein